MDDSAKGRQRLHPVCAVGDDGAVNVAWGEADGDTQEVWYRRLDGGSPSGEPVLAERERAGARIAAGDGTVAVAWPDAEVGGAAASRIDEAGAAVPAVALGGARDLAFTVRDGQAVAVWTAPNGAIWIAHDLAPRPVGTMLTRIS